MTTPTYNGAMRGRAMSIMIHADTKVGKSTVAATCPKPMVLFDVEAAYRFLDAHLNGRMVFWNPLTEAPPEPDGTWDIATVKVLDYPTLARGVEYLVYGNHKFISASFDSISEAQKRFKSTLQANSGGNMDQQTWGALLDETEKLCRNLRDLTEHPTTPLEAVVVTAMTEMREGKWRPYLQGASRNTTPYFFDVIGYMDVYDYVSDPAVPAVRYRRMQVNKSPVFEAGERVGGRLGDVIWNPNMSDMLDTVFGKKPEIATQEPVAATAPETREEAQQ